MMNFKQQINLKFLIRFEKTPTETFKLLQEVDVVATMSRTQHFELHKRFKDAREIVEGQQQAEQTKMLRM